MVNFDGIQWNVSGKSIAIPLDFQCNSTGKPKNSIEIYHWISSGFPTEIQWYSIKIQWYSIEIQWFFHWNPVVFQWNPLVFPLKSTGFPIEIHWYFHRNTLFFPPKSIGFSIDDRVEMLLQCLIYMIWKI